MTTGGACSAICAFAFGKEEGGDFAFTQTMIDSIVADGLVYFSGPMTPYRPELPPFYLRPLLYLCVSDLNKNLLVQSSGLITLLTETLLLDSEHTRQDQNAAIKAAIQQDAAECFLQLAL